MEHEFSLISWKNTTKRLFLKASLTRFRILKKSSDSWNGLFSLLCTLGFLIRLDSLRAK
jgi:hypothetical protein